MVIVLRFVDIKGILRVHLFDIVHVKNTSSLALKNEIISVLSRHGLNIQNIHGQGYDGANNMRGQFNGLQALIANECPYAYYIHCLAYRLQLILVTPSSEVLHMETFFEKLKYIVNSCTSSAKRNDELHDFQIEETTQMTQTGELEIGSGLNQIGNLQRAGDTRWGSHLKSVTSLITMFNATRRVLDHIIEEGNTPTQRGQAFLALESLKSFEFVLILHFVK
ncbi:hypothetical protein LIER_39970 [Lithospermum erythrorhizon]|uniref:DUF4371 domain-containing protein n=1 Tax=Lithospermum erythrorhizon TaxID=34254 RepID=A0AAV3QRX3_LITER